MVSSALAIAVTEAAEATSHREEPSVRQVVMSKTRAPPCSSDDLRRHLSDHHCPVHSPSGRLHWVGLTQPFWINLVIYLFAVGGLGFPVLFGMWPAAVIHALFVILTRK